MNKSTDQNKSPRPTSPERAPSRLQASRKDAGSATPVAPAPVAHTSGVLAREADGSAFLDPGIAELETLLRELLVEHEQLLTLAHTQKLAIRRADTAALGSCIHQQNEIVQRVAELEKRRLALTMRLAERLKPAQKSASASVIPDRPTITWLVQSLPVAVRDRIVRAADRLRELLMKLHREHAALKEAAAALATHMEAVIRQVTGRLSHAGTYGRRGTVENRVQIVSTLDLRS